MDSTREEPVDRVDGGTPHVVLLPLKGDIETAAEHAAVEETTLPGNVLPDPVLGREKAIKPGPLLLTHKSSAGTEPPTIVSEPPPAEPAIGSSPQRDDRPRIVTNNCQQRTLHQQASDALHKANNPPTLFRQDQKLVQVYIVKNVPEIRDLTPTDMFLPDPSCRLVQGFRRNVSTFQPAGNPAKAADHTS